MENLYINNKKSQALVSDRANKILEVLSGLTHQEVNMVLQAVSGNVSIMSVFNYSGSDSSN
jgi:hypothetical protein